MRQIKICDMTMLQEARHKDRFSLTFKEKTEIAELLDNVGIDVIALEGADDDKSDILRLKAIAGSVKNAVLAVAVKPDKANIDLINDAVKEAKHKRLVLSLPVSTVQMEYSYRLKQEGMLRLIKESLAYMAEVSDDTEFVAVDATRADREFLREVLKTAADAGIKTVSVYDVSGKMLPKEFGEFVSDLMTEVPELKKVHFGAGCSNEITMAAACLIEAAQAGADELKAAAFAVDTAFLNDISRVIFEKEELGIKVNLKAAETSETISRIRWMCKTGKSKTSAFDNEVLGQDSDNDDEINEAFNEEVPEVFKIDSYTINTGSVMTSTAHIRLNKSGRMLEEVVMGDGPIDASFLAIERITGTHFELEDFQIKAISEGREALGQALVRLRSARGLYTGVGRSTDIIGACIKAYINALNKIADKESI
ncbi:MAG: alpha-isopropylmalate synthase regulatory domain-containing protein [Lachnospiraceae bacterium]|nr:alpha-isopropylmalate synthase regulatory domain-containing protein [Lachnospiraceae bacterium]